ncbi:hypothetical protein OXJ01_003650 [Salmonella enterica]|nr:hypothetical protein [Salmonella enterica]
MAITTDNVSATFTWSGPEQGWVITSGVGLGQGRVYSREIFTQILASETSAVTLNTPPTIVDVYADGKRLAESKYSLDGNVITFSPSLPANTELQVIEYTPIQLGNGGGSGSSTITWVYNGGSAIGGETEITLDIVVDDVPAIDINGSRQYKNLGFTFDPLTSKITLAQELDAEDEVVVIINGTPNIYNQIDYTLREVARVTNVKDTEVVYFSVGAVLSGYKVIYDKVTQRSYFIPELPTGTTAVSLSSSAVLVHSAGSVDLGALAVSREEYVTLPGSFDTGVTVNTKNELVVSNDIKYRWDGSVPKVVPPESTPLDTGGVGPGAWLVVGVVGLEQRLASWKGSSLIDSGSLSLYKKTGVFGDGGNVSDKYQVVLHSDGFWYKYNGTLPVSYGAAPDSSWTNVGKLTGFNEHSPENFGAIPNDPSFDCLPAIKLAIATGTLNLNGNSTYHVTDEVVIPSYLRGNLNGATIKAIGSVWPTLKAVVRVSKFPVGTATVDVANTENQVRGLRLIGSLNVDCADIASYGFYARLLCAESEMGSIYVYNANRYGIVIFACWYFQMGTLHANNCARGMALGYSTEGEQGDTYVNATHFPHISAWGTDKSMGLGYDPITDDASKYTIGAGIILGRGLSTSVGVICSENTAGAGVITMDPAAWDIGVMYCEGNSKDFTQEGEPKVSLLSSKANSESHTLTISTLHLSAGCGILTRSKQERVLIRSLYRFDNSKTFHSYCTADTVEIGSSNHYVLNGHNYNAPAALIKEPLNVDFVRSGLTLSEWTSTVIGHFAGSTAEQQLYVKLPASPSGLDLQIASEDGTEYITVTGTDFKVSLTKKRLPSKLYEIRIGGVSTVAVTDCSILVRSKKGDWYYW